METGTVLQICCFILGVYVFGLWKSLFKNPAYKSAVLTACIILSLFSLSEWGLSGILFLAVCLLTAVFLALVKQHGIKHTILLVRRKVNKAFSFLKAKKAKEQFKTASRKFSDFVTRSKSSFFGKEMNFKDKVKKTLFPILYECEMQLKKEKGKDE